MVDLTKRQFPLCFDERKGGECRDFSNKLKFVPNFDQNTLFRRYSEIFNMNFIYVCELNVGFRVSSYLFLGKLVF